MRRLCPVVTFLIVAPPAWAQAPAEFKARPPELEERAAHEWINSKPLKLADLKGRVVVVHFWTFGCINCIRNQPHYKTWHDDFSEKGVTLIGIHTPETGDERDLDALRKNIEEQGLKYPIVMDQDGKTWKAWDNRWWPSTYLIDKQGVARYRWDGELNWKDAKGEATMRKKIKELLAEPGPKKSEKKSAARQDTAKRQASARATQPPFQSPH